MAEERADVALRGLVRWIVIAAVVLIGIGLYFRLAPRSRPVVSPSASEAVQ